MNSLTEFSFEGKEIRFVGTADAPEWVAQDICDVLGIKNVSDTLADFEVDEKGVENVDTPGGNQKLLTVTEPGLYRLVFGSRKAIAKRFRRWVLHEVLPSIRKTGKYEASNRQSHAEEAAKLSAVEIVEISDAIVHIKTTLAPIDARTAQLFCDALMNKIVTAKHDQTSLSSTSAITNSNEPVWRGVVEIAERTLGINVSLSDRTKLGKYVRHSEVGHLGRKEERLCNGTYQPIFIYPHTPEVEGVVKEFFSYDFTKHEPVLNPWNDDN